ncbi:trypsin-like peptidase domain-containing protein [Amycolatopsis cynarae]|uniref:Trypsin-like peptidase domain-containing protein n=1 Tax=Amycolatopsis cynarae TaxID=2995223 RepID=A0ABY7B5G2_9PSEU|nr:trypsin-like peptidase domain-containing protein [Amycolatopsis sp. HUAS 11-8]WAL66487.1 trypsin-like peptidase domain-containing protein [Amycolatopsis sp. HUAS 11-8]
MTENDPNAPQAGGAPRDDAQPSQQDATPPRGTPLGAEQQPNPWSAQGAQQPQYPWTSPSAQQAHQQPGSPYGTAVFPVQQPAIPQQRGSGRGKLVAGIAALALVVGGAAGATGGYLAGNSGQGGGSSYNALTQPVPSQQTGNAPAGSVEAVAQKVSPSVVELVVAGSQEQGEGSGFVLSSDGYVLTNNHVVEVAANGGTIQAVFPNGTKAPASIVGRDPTTDIAVVKVQGAKNLTPVELGNSDAMKVGQSVVAFGSPFELAGTVTSGIVSALHRPVRAGGSSGDQTTVMSAIQTDAAINPGNSGGPLVNLGGQVIGINSAIYSPQSSGGFGQQQTQATNAGIGFAIPINQARRTAQEIINTGKATQTYIGANVSDAQSGGAQIQSVQAGSPAGQAGLKGGDVVVKVDDLVINDADGLIAAVRTRAPNDKATFTLSDGRTVQVTLGGQPVQVK